MATNFPASLDSLTNPSSSDSLNSPSHSAQHANVNDAVEALQAKVGADSSGVASSHDYKIAQLEAGATGGKILQVVSTTKTDTFTAAITATWTDVTGLNLSITPTSATSKVFVIVTCPVIDANIDGGQVFMRVTRDGTVIVEGDASSPQTEIGFGHVVGTRNRNAGSNFTFLDSPASTSALDYQVEMWAISNTVYVNRYFSDSSNGYPRATATITAMEVSA